MTASQLEIQPRDIELLRGLFESRVMTLRHITALYFNGHNEAARKRIQRLVKVEILQKGRLVGPPNIYRLGRFGYETLRQRGMLEGYPQTGWPAFMKRSQVSPLTFAHELEVVDVKAAFTRAVADRPSMSLKEFSTWPRLYQFNVFHPVTRDRVTVKPDGFIRLHESSRDRTSIFYLEVDRSTEGLVILVNKAKCYWEHYRRGGLTKKFGHSPNAYKRFPFRVLVVCKSPERRDNIALALLATQPPLRGFVCLTTLCEVLQDSFGVIWVQPKTYRELTESGPLKIRLLDLEK